MSNSNIHPLFETLVNALAPKSTSKFEELAEKHYDIWVPNSEESCEKEHATISVKFAIESIEDIVLAAYGPADLLNQIQIKVNELKQLIA
ncbi:MAG TPA: hypothetical protein VN922_23850 [Bacteroidia bacterium]|nr:hypothetical protein [Bacteroidia bacterium]